ncbi:hypothetical protein E3N88_44957 [Mikania micrantha]|uniref:Uncharacterized protein n=1 Tax=Mikania micrantha TaxID=192012 RepID=A0A5N6LAS7_9ASTR|nr:hypothetical protein E3N88_44957 [Mikania micrantha]
MEGKKQASSSSSFTNELFGSKESSSSSSSTSYFNSLFPPVSKTHRMDYISSEETVKSYDSATERGSIIDKDSADKYDDRSLNPKTDMSLYYQQPPTQPCHLSSSIYYGGQDVYTNPLITKDAPANSTQYNKDGEDDGRASRGNWWQGCLRAREAKAYMALLEKLWNGFNYVYN